MLRVLRHSRNCDAISESLRLVTAVVCPVMSVVSVTADSRCELHMSHCSEQGQLAQDRTQYVNTSSTTHTFSFSANDVLSFTESGEVPNVNSLQFTCGAGRSKKKCFGSCLQSCWLCIVSES